MRIPLILLCGATLAAGYGCSGNAPLWGTHQEPVEPVEISVESRIPELQRLWRESVGAGDDSGYAILQPTYGSDGIYVAARQGSISKLDPENGATLWQRDLGEAIFSGVGVGDGLAVVTWDNSRVIALAADSGETVWEATIGRQLSAVPAVGGGRVIVRSADGHIFALDAADGEEVWSAERRVPSLTIHGDSTPVISDDTMLAGLANGKLVAYSVVNGREHWETEVSLPSGQNELERLTDSDSEPLVSAATVYAAAYQGNVAAFDFQDASVQWSTEVSSRLPMELYADTLFITDELGEMVAINATTGDQRWRQKMFRGHGMSRPLVVAQRVVVGDAEGNIYSLNREDGTPRDILSAVNGAVIALIPAPRSSQFAVLSSKGELSVVSLEE